MNFVLKLMVIHLGSSMVYLLCIYVVVYLIFSFSSRSNTFLNLFYCFYVSVLSYFLSFVFWQYYHCYHNPMTLMMTIWIMLVMMTLSYHFEFRLVSSPTSYSSSRRRRRFSRTSRSWFLLLLVVLWSISFRLSCSVFNLRCTLKCYWYQSCYVCVYFHFSTNTVTFSF
jgi:hypothetical protein